MNPITEGIQNEFRFPSRMAFAQSVIEGGGLDILEVSRGTRPSCSITRQNKCTRMNGHVPQQVVFH